MPGDAPTKYDPGPGDPGATRVVDLAARRASRPGWLRAVPDDDRVGPPAPSEKGAVASPVVVVGPVVQTFLAPADPVDLALWEIAALPSDWDGQGAVAPAPVACDHARQVLAIARTMGLPPARVVPDVNGGVAAYWFGRETLPGGAHLRRGHIVCDNDGDATALVSAHQIDPDAWTVVDVPESIRRIALFVRG